MGNLNTSSGILHDDENREQFLHNLTGNGTISVSSKELAQIDSKMKREIAAKYHKNAITEIKEGRYKGYCQTYFGIGKRRKLKRFKTFNDLYRYIVEYYSIGTLTLKAYFPHWLNWKCERNNNKTQTKDQNQKAFEKYVGNSRLGSMKLTRITSEDLENWCIETLVAHPMTSCNWNTYKIVVRGPLELAVREHIIETNPWVNERIDYRHLLKSKRRAPSKNKIFYDEEIDDLIRAFSAGYAENRNSANIALMINFDLGLRIGELAALKWADIDWHQGSIFIQRQESNGTVEEYVKSDSSCGYRELALSGNVQSLLRELRANTVNPSQYIFVSEEGERRTTTQFAGRLENAEKYLGWPKQKRSHCIRRTVATKMFCETKDLEAVRQWLGHTDVETTLRYIYSTMSDKDMKAYLESSSRIPKYLPRPASKEKENKILMFPKAI